MTCIRFLLLTGWREGEATGLRWDAVDFARGFATLADTKTGRSFRNLGAPALALLAELPRLEGSPYVFPGRAPGSHIGGVTRLWYAVRHAAGLDDVRLHDLRHGFASVAAGGGVSLQLIASVLGHRELSTTQRYAQLADDPRKVAADQVSGEVARLLAGQARPENVLPFKRHRG